MKENEFIKYDEEPCKLPGNDPFINEKDYQTMTELLDAAKKELEKSCGPFDFETAAKIAHVAYLGSLKKEIKLSEVFGPFWKIYTQINLSVLLQIQKKSRNTYSYMKLYSMYAKDRDFIQFYNIALKYKINEVLAPLGIYYALMDNDEKAVNIWKRGASIGLGDCILFLMYYNLLRYDTRKAIDYLKKLRLYISQKAYRHAQSELLSYNNGTFNSYWHMKENFHRQPLSPLDENTSEEPIPIETLPYGEAMTKGLKLLEVTTELLKREMYEECLFLYQLYNFKTIPYQPNGLLAKIIKKYWPITDTDF